jgi:hypothetical protein
MTQDSKHIFNNYSKSLVKENLDPVGKEDKDVNNDGKVDATDKLILKRREAINKAIQSKKQEEEEKQKTADHGLHNDALYIWDYLLHKRKYSPQDAMKVISLAKGAFEHMV